DGPQVARVLDTVEDHDQRGRARLLQQLLHADDRLGGDHGDEPLVRDAARHPVQRLPRLEAQRDAEGAGPADRVRHATVAQPLDHEQAVEVTRARGERLQHRVDPADEVHVVLSVTYRSRRRNRTTAWAAMPSPRPMAPRPSMLLALTETAS